MSERQVTPAFDRMPQDGAGRPFMLAVSALLLNLGLLLALDPDHPSTIAVLTASVAAALIAVGAPTFGALQYIRKRHVVGLLASGLVAQLILIAMIPPGSFLYPQTLLTAPPYTYGYVLLSVGSIAITVTRSWGPTNPLFLGVVGVFLLVGTWVIDAAPDPFIDVHIIQERGADALLRGENPYAIRDYPDIYGADSAFYAPGLVKDGELTFGYIYPPLSILMTAPVQAVTGDYRHAHLGAMAMSAVLIAAIRPGAVGTLAALVFLITPRTFYILEHGWTDPLAVMLLALTALLADRRSRFLPVALGLSGAVKQHLALVVPIAAAGLNGTLSGRGRLLLLVRSGGIGLVVTLPFALWGFHDFVNSTVLVHLRQPFRSDSLSYLAWFGESGAPWLPTWVPFALLLPVASWSLMRLGRSTAAVVTTAALTYFVFFLFGQQAFTHYYYYVVAALCIAVVAWQPARERARQGG